MGVWSHAWGALKEAAFRAIGIIRIVQRREEDD
jgi:hypothetical protein